MLFIRLPSWRIPAGIVSQQWKSQKDFSLRLPQQHFVLTYVATMVLKVNDDQKQKPDGSCFNVRSEY